MSEGSMVFRQIVRNVVETETLRYFRDWKAAVHSALVGLCFAFILAVIFGFVSTAPYGEGRSLTGPNPTYSALR